MLPRLMLLQRITGVCSLFLLRAIPEPASVFSTMGLVASGLLIRRRKQVA